ncbi:hypothetical protein M9978_13330 [Sphingomonas sp. MG17]|jgi:NAD(P)-dependent dehydrogenase (short-subunit alcohol dehydrogenase family)|uniref:Short chain dehydrogenase n=1 Tax=Sphingomonas tagetis TaxID=2949092 RepID=A0A9X2HMZ7_9SPHN|nr:hypothetical protein [Sphingomonas tagetis]MCP3731406.1 hypothetical protein [Sphingomonas tagetis]
MKQLSGKVAVITGAGSGIGAGMARAFAAAGMQCPDAHKNRSQDAGPFFG